MTCSPVARLKRIPRMKGFGNRIAARSRSTYARRKARTSSCEVLKLAKALASSGAVRGSIVRGAFIRKGAFTGGSIVPPTPYESGRRWAPPESALLACADRWLLHSVQIHAVRAGQMIEAFRHPP